MYLIFEYYSNNTLFVFVFGHNSEPEYYSYLYSANYLCTNIIRICIRSFWENEYYSYSYLVKILIPNIIRIRIWSEKQYSLTSNLRWFCYYFMIVEEELSLFYNEITLLLSPWVVHVWDWRPSLLVRSKLSSGLEFSSSPLRRRTTFLRLLTFVSMF